MAFYRHLIAKNRSRQMPPQTVVPKLSRSREAFGPRSIRSTKKTAETAVCYILRVCFAAQGASRGLLLPLVSCQRRVHGISGGNPRSQHAHKLIHEKSLKSPNQHEAAVAASSSCQRGLSTHDGV